MPTIKMSGQIRYSDILDVLEVKSIPDVDHNAAALLSFDAMHIESEDMIDALESRNLLPEPEAQEANIRDLRDGFTHLRNGEIALARILLCRAFENFGDEKLPGAIEQSLRDWPWVPDHG